MRREIFRKSLTDALATHLRTGKAPNLPAGGHELWNIFMQLGATRTHHAHGPHAISFQEIEAWSRLHRVPLQPHHIEIIRALDEVLLRHEYEKIVAKLSGIGKGKPSFDSQRYANAPQMTPAAFDAVFG